MGEVPQQDPRPQSRRLEGVTTDKYHFVATYAGEDAGRTPRGYQSHAIATVRTDPSIFGFHECSRRVTRTILVPVEGAPLSMKALETALVDYPDDDVVVVHVMDPIGSGLSLIDVMRPTFEDGSPPGSVSPKYWREWREKAQTKADEVFEEVREIADDHGRSVDTVLEFGEPDDVIIEYAEEEDVDRIVMGSHCRTGAERFLVGSVAQRVVKRAPVPVMIVR